MAAPAIWPGRFEKKTESSKWKWFEMIFLWNILWEVKMINCLIDFLPVYLQVIVFLINQGKPVIILCKILWTASSFAHFRAFQVRPTYESMMLMYMDWIKSLEFIERGLCRPSIGHSAALMFFTFVTVSFIWRLNLNLLSKVTPRYFTEVLQVTIWLFMWRLSIYMGIFISKGNSYCFAWINGNTPFCKPGYGQI